MHFFYADTTEPLNINLSNLNPTTMYLKHLDNYFYLKFIANNSDNFIEKQQANKELLIAQKKMNFWSKKPHINNTIVTKETNKLKKMWG